MALADTVNLLPAELLLHIFRLVFTANFAICSPTDTNCMTCRRIGTHHVAWGPTEAFDKADPALFPFALAAVLPRWRAVLATVPEYWTRPVFFVDHLAPTSLADVTDFLHFSNNLPIEVYITRRDFRSDDNNEQGRVRAVIDALKPHLSRCQYLFIRLSRSSSLPSLRHDFTGTAPYLTQLKLDCEVDDGINTTALTQPFPKDPFRCPALYTLLIDGPNFREIAMNHSPWWAHTFNTSRSLIIRNLTSSPPLPFDLALACLNLHTLANLRLFTLSNASFDTKSPATDRPPKTYPFGLQMLVLSKTSFPFLSYFFKRTFLGDLYSIRIEACTFPSLPPSSSLPSSSSSYIDNTGSYASIIPNTFSLTLKNVTHPSHFISLLRTWRGQRLNIDSSPGFDDSVLAMMCSPIQDPTTNLTTTTTTTTTIEEPLLSSSSASSTSSNLEDRINDLDIHSHHQQFYHASMLGCPNLSNLYLVDCTNFTPQGIKRLLDVRNNRSEGVGDDDDDDPSEVVVGVTTGILELITIVGRGPCITAADKECFDREHTVKWECT